MDFDVITLSQYSSDQREPDRVQAEAESVNVTAPDISRPFPTGQCFIVMDSTSVGETDQPTSTPHRGLAAAP